MADQSQFIERFGIPRTNDNGLPLVALGDIAKLQLGKMVDAKKQTGLRIYPYLANFNVKWFEFDLTELRKMDFDDQAVKKYELLDGDLLVCEGGEVCRCAIWHNNVFPCYFQKALYRVRCNKTVLLPEYLSRVLYYWWQDNKFEDIIGSKATILHMPSDKLKSLMIPLPTITAQEEFQRIIDQSDKSKFRDQIAIYRDVRGSGE